jgi:hypothetical protein
MKAASARCRSTRPACTVLQVRIGVDASGKFATGSGFEPTVVAAAIASDGTFRQIREWADDALRRWGIADRFDELHAKKLRPNERLEICEMLAERGDVRLSGVVTDPGLLGSAEAVALHRRRQRAKAEDASPATPEGQHRQRELLALLADEALQDGEYLLGACLPLVLTQAAQQAFCFFGTDDYRDEMFSFVVRIDEERAPTIRYSGGALFPTLGGDERFSFRFSRDWAKDPQHPFFERVRHPDGDGSWPQDIFDDIDWVASRSETAIQVADVAAWVLARRIKKPEDAAAAESFGHLAPLLAGEGGRRFALFSIPPIRADQAAMYQHLQFGQEPARWLKPMS